MAKTFYSRFTNVSKNCILTNNFLLFEFQSAIDIVEKGSESIIKYPSNNEEFGGIALGWRIPGKFSDVYKEIHALSILGDYLSSTPVSPLKKAFIEISEPIVNDIFFDVLKNEEAAISIEFESVQLNKMYLDM